ncbi:fibrillin-2-like [Sycon ciliatum]|uniref:fibrillin-2-like n=1 Tax=Sycon ciliatum TaxID=27933 RepID=UPI0031F68F78
MAFVCLVQLPWRGAAATGETMQWMCAVLSLVSMFSTQILLADSVSSIVGGHSGDGVVLLQCAPGQLNCSTSTVACSSDSVNPGLLACSCADNVTATSSAAGAGLLGASCVEIDPCRQGSVQNCSRTGGVCSVSSDGESNCYCSGNRSVVGDEDDAVFWCVLLTENCDSGVEDGVGATLGSTACAAIGGECGMMSNGRTRCVCKEGYAGNGHVCSDIDECHAHTHNCSRPGALCTNTAGSFLCTCRPGYQGNGLTCHDITECELGLHDCSAVGSRCSNMQGSFLCTCQAGFAGDGRLCRDIDECVNRQHICSRYAQCHNSIGGYSCGCLGNYSGDGYRCHPDECAMGVHRCHGDNIVCLDTEAGFDCMCPVGFELDSTHFGCQDRNECLLGNSCQQNYMCVNLEGSFACLCAYGFELARVLGPTQCLDVDECDSAGNGNDCDAVGELCRNVPGSYECQCHDGFSRSEANSSCKEINECSTMTEPCQPGSQCRNTEGSYVCSCLPGFLLVDGQCHSLPECTEQTDIDRCNSTTHALCKLYNTTEMCLCANGFSMSQHGCWNMNECIRGQHDCFSLEHTECVDTAGSYECLCSTGYILDDNQQCQDVEECADNMHDCDGNATCRNSVGTFHCLCNTGFTGTGHTDGCENVNECVHGLTANTRTMNPDATVARIPCTASNMQCADTVASYRCDCLPDYYMQHDGQCRPSSELFTPWSPPQPGTPTSLTWPIRKFDYQQDLQYTVIAINLGPATSSSSTSRVFHVSPDILYNLTGPNVYSYAEALETRQPGSTPRAYVVAEFHSSLFGHRAVLPVTVGDGTRLGQWENGPLPPGHAFTLWYQAAQASEDAGQYSQMRVVAASSYLPIQETTGAGNGHTTVSVTLIVAAAGGLAFVMFLSLCLVALMRRQRRLAGKGRMCQPSRNKILGSSASEDIKIRDRSI